MQCKAHLWTEMEELWPSEKGDTCLYFMVIQENMLFKNGGMSCPAVYFYFAHAHSHALSWSVLALMCECVYKYIQVSAQIATFSMGPPSLLKHATSNTYIHTLPPSCTLLFPSDQVSTLKIVLSQMYVWCHSTVWIFVDRIGTWL